MRDSLVPRRSFLLLVAALFACAKPSTMPSDLSPNPSPAADPVAIEQDFRAEAAVTREGRMQRLEDAALPLLRHGTALCGDEVPHYGFRYASLDEYEDAAERDAYSKLFGVLRQPTVIGVTRGGAAERAGLRPGDAIVALDGRRVSPAGAGLDEIFRRLRFGMAGRSVLVRRGEADVPLEITPEPACDFPLELSSSGEINAAAWGRTITVNTGLMRFIESDRWLQFVIAHEMAHNTMRHLDQMIERTKLDEMRGYVRDAVEEAAGGVKPLGKFSQDQECEADYVGMYYLARAGIDTHGVAGLWRRMAAENPDGIPRRSNATHPSYPDRFLHLEAVHDEIVRKLEAGDLLFPADSVACRY